MHTLPLSHTHRVAAAWKPKPKQGIRMWTLFMKKNAVLAAAA